MLGMAGVRPRGVALLLVLAASCAPAPHGGATTTAGLTQASQAGSPAPPALGSEPALPAGSAGVGASSSVAVAPPPVASPAEPTVPAFAFDPEIAAAVARIDARAYARDLAAIVGERNDVTAPAHLAAVTRTVGLELGRAGFLVRRETVRHGARVADNLIADRPGTDAGRVVAIGAHLDTVPSSPGADDDGSGVAALLGIARAAARVPTTAGLRILAFAFEEDGLVGASQHVQGLPESERARIVAMIDMDMIGFRDRRPGSQRYPAGIEQLVPQPLPDTGDFIAAVGLEGEIVLPAMIHAQRYVPELRAGVVPLRRWQIFAAPDTMRGDHAPFWLAGIPAAQVGDTGDFRNPHYHQPTDRLETVDAEFATLVARWVGASALTLARVTPPAQR